MRSIVVLLTMRGLMAQDSSQLPEWQGWIKQGVEEFRQGRYSDAIPAFQKAAGMNPASPIPHLYLRISWYQGYIPGAESPDNALQAQHASAEYRRALELDPKNWNALVLLGQVSFYVGKLDEAREWYRKAQVVDPKSAGVWYTLGVIAWRQSLLGGGGPSVAEAISSFEKAVALDPAHEDAMTFLNLLLRERREGIAEADRWLDRAEDARSNRVQTEIARAETVRLPEAAGADLILRQWAWLAVNYPPPPPPPDDLTDGQTAGDTSSAVVSWEPRNADEKEAPAPIRVAPAEQERRMITKVNPAYPATAKAGVQYALRFVVVIGKDGRVASETLVGGNPRLVPSAVRALHQWIYQPTLVNGQPVEVVTEVRVGFKPGNG